MSDAIAHRQSAGAEEQREFIMLEQLEHRCASFLALARAGSSASARASRRRSVELYQGCETCGSADLHWPTCTRGLAHAQRARSFGHRELVVLLHWSRWLAAASSVCNDARLALTMRLNSIALVCRPEVDGDLFRHAASQIRRTRERRRRLSNRTQPSSVFRASASIVKLRGTHGVEARGREP